MHIGHGASTNHQPHGAIIRHPGSPTLQIGDQFIEGQHVFRSFLANDGNCKQLLFVPNEKIIKPLCRPKHLVEIFSLTFNRLKYADPWNFDLDALPIIAWRPNIHGFFEQGIHSIPERFVSNMLDEERDMI